MLSLFALLLAGVTRLQGDSLTPAPTLFFLASASMTFKWHIMNGPGGNILQQAGCFAGNNGGPLYVMPITINCTKKL